MPDTAMLLLDVLWTRCVFAYPTNQDIITSMQTIIMASVTADASSELNFPDEMNSVVNGD